MLAGIKHIFKYSAVVALLCAQRCGLLRPASHNSALIFMMHRMEDLTHGIRGHSPEFLRATLSYMRREGYNLISLEEIIRRLQNNEVLPRKSVAFTIDDGFLDQATVAAPIFNEFDCPVTIFLITGFLDGLLWPWDDRVNYAFTKSKRNSLSVRLGTMDLQYDLSTPALRRTAARDFRARAKLISEDAMIQGLTQLAIATDVELPAAPSSPYMPMTWGMARELENKGVTFGPHTVSHRILSRMTPERARYEIVESWRRLKDELSNPLPLFAYPTGRRIDFTMRDINILHEVGFLGAVTAEPGHADFSPWKNDQYARFQIYRYALPDNLDDVMQCCSGLEQAKDALRLEKLQRYAVEKYGGLRPIVRHLTSLLWYKLGGYRRFREIDWSRVNRLVFVCKGNICRSPYAEMKVRRYGIEAVSLGLYAKSGSRADPIASTNAAVRDIDLAPHRSRHPDDIRIQPGDLLVGMEPWHARILLRLARKSGAQTTLMGLWSKPSRPYIHDPFGCADEYFQACFSVIDQSIDGLMGHLKISSDFSRKAHATR